MRTSVLRTRWAAIGAAVAVSLGAGGIGLVDATTSSGEMPIYVPIEPCRLADTRPDFQVGPRSTPLGAAEIYTLSGWGSHGQCTLPSQTTALALNVTAIGPSVLTHLTLYPGSGSPPTASHLNPAPGQPPTPNAVNVDLDTSGAFSIFNFQGAVHVIIDVVGYFDDHVHRAIDLVDEPGVSFHNNPGVVSATNTPTAMISTELRAPADGWILVEVSGHWLNLDTTSVTYCQIQLGDPVAISPSTDDPWVYLNAYGDSSRWTHFSAHRMIPILAAGNPPILNAGQDVSFVCDEASGNTNFDDLNISATYFPTMYEPLIFIPL